eukprot:1195168-Prorocentrum_minimum.AAC.4
MHLLDEDVLAGGHRPGKLAAPVVVALRVKIYTYKESVGEQWESSGRKWGQKLDTGSEKGKGFWGVGCTLQGEVGISYDGWSGVVWSGEDAREPQHRLQTASESSCTVHKGGMSRDSANAERKRSEESRQEKQREQDRRIARPCAHLEGVKLLSGDSGEGGGALVGV